MAWLFQDQHQVQKYGAARAAWSVGWYEPDGTKRQKSFGAGKAGRTAAFRHQKRLEAELLTGTYDAKRNVPWKKFRADFNEDRLAAMSDKNKECVTAALGHFERVCKPRHVNRINRRTLDKYVTARVKERGKKPGSKLSPATLAKELRYLKAVLTVAHEWGYLGVVPSVPKVKEPDKLPPYVTGEHFAAIYRACDEATMPVVPNVAPADWWRAFLVFAYMTGWRAKELFRLKASDLDLKAGRAMTRHGDNKGKRDDTVRLHPVVIEHLGRLKHFGKLVFPWPHGYEDRWHAFHAIQTVAGIHLECDEDHQHTEACHLYGFHALRRAFATENEESLSASELQALMRHKSFTTTQRYINMAKRLRGGSADKLHVPDVLGGSNGGKVAGRKASESRRVSRKSS